MMDREMNQERLYDQLCERKRLRQKQTLAGIKEKRVVMVKDVCCLICPLAVVFMPLQDQGHTCFSGAQVRLHA